MVDEHVGATVKQKFKNKLEKMMLEDPILFKKINSSGLSFMRIQFTKLACDAYDETMKEMDIPAVFKACGLANDINGGERHLIKCGNLLSYEAPENHLRIRKYHILLTKLNILFKKKFIPHLH